MSQTWRQCVELLESELSDTDLNTWIRPLQAFEANTSIKIMAPNRFVQERVTQQFLERIQQLIKQIGGDASKSISIDVGSQPAYAEPPVDVDTCLLYTSPSPRDQRGSRMPSSA